MTSNFANVSKRVHRWPAITYNATALKVILMSYDLHFSTAGEQPNCDDINTKDKEEHLKENNWFKRMSTGAAVASAIGCIAVGVIMIAGFILVVSRPCCETTYMKHVIPILP